MFSPSCSCFPQTWNTGNTDEYMISTSPWTTIFQRLIKWGDTCQYLSLLCEKIYCYTDQSRRTEEKMNVTITFASCPLVSFLLSRWKCETYYIFDNYHGVRLKWSTVYSTKLLYVVYSIYMWRIHLSAFLQRIERDIKTFSFLWYGTDKRGTRMS